MTQDARKVVNTLVKGLKRLPDTWVACRDMRHAWSVEEDFHVETSQSVGRKVKAVRRVLVCMRCETRRVEHYLTAKYGLEKVGQSYIYPYGYEIPGVPRGVKPSIIIQQEMYRRSMEQAAGAKPGERETAER